MGYETRRRDRHAQGGPRGRRPRAGHLARRRGAGGPAGRAAAGRHRCAPATRCCSSPAPATSTSASPRPRSRSSILEEVPDIDLRRDRRPRPPDRADPRRGRAALPARRPVQGAPAAAAQGRPALRPAGLRQDAHRQGGRQLAGQEGRRGQPGRSGRARATSSTSRAPSCSTSTSARPSGTSGWSSSGPGRRPARACRSSCSSTRWTRSSAPAGPGCRSDVENTIVPQLLERDRRRRGPGERHRHRRLQPRGHDRPGDPAARPARREDQDRAAGRRGGQGHLLQVHAHRAAAAPRRPGRARRVGGGHGGRR